MVTLELYKRGWNSKYLQYDPAKWAVSIVHGSGGLDITGFEMSSGEKTSYGYFDIAYIRTSPVPTSVSKSDIETWD